MRVEVQPETEVRLGRAGPRDLAGDRQINREDEHARRVILVDLLPEHHALRPLRDDAQDRPRHGVYQLRVRSRGASGVQTGEVQLKATVVRGVSADQTGQPAHVRFARRKQREIRGCMGVRVSHCGV